MKAVQNGDLPNLKRVALIDCIVSDCEWPEVPEFFLETRGMFYLSKIPKVLSKLTEFSDYEPSDIDLVVCLENLSGFETQRNR